MPIGVMPYHEIDVPNPTSPFATALQSGLQAYGDIQKARAEGAKADLPFGGANVPGPAGQIVGLEMVRRLYGEDSPQYKMAKNSFDISQQSNISRTNYQNALSGSLSTRYLTPTGKSIVEEQNVRSGLSPSGSSTVGN